MSARSTARGALRRLPLPVRRRILGGRFATAAAPPLPQPDPFASFTRDDGTAVPLLRGYRDAVKASWRTFTWPTLALYELRRRGALDEDGLALAAEIDRAATLPVAPAEVARAVAAAARAHPDLVRATGAHDDELGQPVLAVVPSAEDVAARVRYYRASAESTLRRLRRAGLPAGARVLEIGCGSGYMTFALGAAGAGEAIGLDREVTSDAAERELVREAFAGRSELRTGDAHELPFEDASLDAVVSFSTLEHLTDVACALAEQRRVLRPGGVAYHAYDPWLSPFGGHALCTLDFPWGHARLSPAETERYLAELRPHEAPIAIRFYREGFQERRLTLAEMRETFAAAGLDVRSWREVGERSGPHRTLAEQHVLAEATRLNARATRRDLLTDNVLVIARRR